MRTQRLQAWRLGDVEGLAEGAPVERRDKGKLGPPEAACAGGPGRGVDADNRLVEVTQDRVGAVEVLLQVRCVEVGAVALQVEAADQRAEGLVDHRDDVLFGDAADRVLCRRPQGAPAVAAQLVDDHAGVVDDAAVVEGGDRHLPYR